MSALPTDGLEPLTQDSISPLTHLSLWALKEALNQEGVAVISPVFLALRGFQRVELSSPPELGSHVCVPGLMGFRLVKEN